LTFESSILLVGADSTDGKTTPATISWDVSNNRIIDANMAIQGRLKGSIEMEFGIKLRSKVQEGKSYKKNEVRQKIEKRKEEGGLGVKMAADSEIHLTLGADKHAADFFTADMYFSGVNVSAMVFINKKWEKTQFPVVPELSKKIDILKNKGEYK
ncbi:MAG: hypothetical protein OIF50_09255, partial [Flavobacteriaceae bacterium]|nr:hypothetical protein [Flavobacteriaceae bacterium]